MNMGLKQEIKLMLLQRLVLTMEDLDLAKKIIESASKTGCDAVKFQTYITEKRAPKGNQEIFDILKKCELHLLTLKN